MIQGALGGAAFLAYSSVNTVEPGYRGVVFSRWSGVGEESLGEGTHFLLPWVRPPRGASPQAPPSHLPGIPLRGNPLLHVSAPTDVSLNIGTEIGSFGCR
jgi:hypothetical protein